jgi:hypothetical protein
MRRILALGIGWWLSCSLLWAQVKVELQLEQSQFLPGESMRTAVRITNLSGQMLKLGQSNDWLRFSVEAVDGFIVSKNEEVPVIGPFDLDSAKVATKRVDLAPYFNLTKAGRYRVTALVKLPQWGQSISSPTVGFDVINGVRLWEQEFGVPGSAGGTGRPEVRKYLLQQATYLKQVALYVRITDASEAITLKVLPLGPLVSFFRPEHQLDQQCNLHVLSQTGARSYLYCVVSPNGVLVGRQIYDSIQSRPSLSAQPDGSIVVHGGSRRVTANDLPLTGTESETPGTKTTNP